MAWQPELTGASRENHIMRSASVVTDVRYGKGKIAYRTYDAIAPSEDVLRLAFAPESVSADGKPLPQRETLSENGYTIKSLPNGDCIVTIRHDGCRDVVVEGDDPQRWSKTTAAIRRDVGRSRVARRLGRKLAHGRGCWRRRFRVRGEPGSADRPSGSAAAAAPTSISTA